jgi:hypothetical protein
MAVSTRNRIRLTGIKDLKQDMFDHLVDWEDGKPIIKKITFIKDKLPFDIGDYPEANAIMILRSYNNDFYYAAEIGSLEEPELPPSEDYSHRLGDKSKLSLLIRKGVHGSDGNKLLANMRSFEYLYAPEDEEGENFKKRGILNVNAKNLDDQIWNLEIDETSGLPKLTINNRDGVIGRDFAKTNDFFRSVVIPKVIEEVTFFYLQRVDWKESEMVYCQRWMNDWVPTIFNDEPPEFQEDEQYLREAREWSMHLAKQVGEKQRFFEKFKTYIQE